MTKPIDPAERTRIAEDLRGMLFKLSIRASQLDASGDAATDKELLWPHRNVTSVVRRHQETFPKEVTGANHE
jgi:hypothetical protein